MHQSQAASSVPPSSRQLDTGGPTSPESPFGKGPVPFDRQTFRSYYRERTLPVTRVGLGFAVLIIAAVCVVDSYSMDQAHASRVVPLRFGLMLLPMFIVFLMSFVEAWRNYLNVAVTLAAFVCGIGTFSDSFVAATMDQPVVLWGNIFFTFFIYLLLGLPFRNSIVAASPILLISIGFGLAYDTPVHKLVYVFFSHVIGMYTSFRLEQDAREIYRNILRLEEVSRTDALSGIFNRRMFDEFFARAWRQARRDGKCIGIVLVDIDYFKDYNDHYGHQAGDECIQKIAQSLACTINRPLDFVARYGGEEFAIVLYAPDETYLERFAEELRSKVESMRLPHAASDAGEYVTVSAGAGIYYPRGQNTAETAISQVDSALYLAKKRGRNRAVIDTPHVTRTTTAVA